MCEKESGQEIFDWKALTIPGLKWNEVQSYVDTLQAKNDNIKIVKDKLDRLHKLKWPFKVFGGWGQIQK